MPRGFPDLWCRRAEPPILIPDIGDWEKGERGRKATSMRDCPLHKSARAGHLAWPARVGQTQGCMRTIITILIGIVAAAVLLWLLLIVCLAILRPGQNTLRQSARIVPDAIRLISRLSRDRTLSRAVRLRLVLLLGYLAFPIDLVPDFIPVIGYADDVIVIGLVLRSVIRRAGPDVVRRHWPGTDAGLDVLARLCRVPALRTES